jgi:hypothetical protein
MMTHYIYFPLGHALGRVLDSHIGLTNPVVGQRMNLVGQGLS